MFASSIFNGYEIYGQSYLQSYFKAIFKQKLRINRDSFRIEIDEKLQIKNPILTSRFKRISLHLFAGTSSEIVMTKSS